jgi:hypothetical protein
MGVCYNSIYELALPTRPGLSIGHWEAINILVAIHVFSSSHSGKLVHIWCDSKVAVSVLNSGRGADPILQSVARNIWLEQAKIDCELCFTHLKGQG